MGPAPADLTLPPSGDTVECACNVQDVNLVIAGGVHHCESVAAAKYLPVKGMIVAKQGVVGIVIGQSSPDPNGCVATAFTHSEKGRGDNLHFFPKEIQRMQCAGGLSPGDRIDARRQLLVVPPGAFGIVLGPSCARPSRVTVSFPNVDGKEVVLHVELGNLHVLADDVDRIGSDVETQFPLIAAQYAHGAEVVVARDLSDGRQDIVRGGVLSTVIGSSDHSNQDRTRVTDSLAWWEDGNTNNLDVVPREVCPVEVPNATHRELCSVCLSELLAEGEELRCMPCSHVLHATCLRALLSYQASSGKAPSDPALQWLMRIKPTRCPVCRRDTLP